MRKGEPLAEPPEVSASLIAAIRTRVEDLAMLETLTCEDTAIKECFADCFPDDIPHLLELLSNIFHEFKLKDPE